MSTNKKISTTEAGFSDFEKEAMRNRAKELRAEAKATNKRAQGETAVQEAISAMNDSDQAMAKKIHEIVTRTAPELMPKTWYGMPAYALDDKVVCFFQGADKFKARYSTLGFSDTAKLDSGEMWATSFALKKLTADVEKEIAVLVRKAVNGK